MSSFRPRFTVRRLLIMLTFVGCILGAGKLWRQQKALNSTAMYLARVAKLDLRSAELREHTDAKLDAVAVEQQRLADVEARAQFKEMYQQHLIEAKAEAKDLRDEAQEYRDDAAKHSRLARKFRNAASRPWQPWRSVDPELRTLQRID